MDSGHNCEQTQNYSAQYDAYYCAECNVWLEDTCDDRECLFCPSRPEHPVNETTD
jgi:hypothetical protein